jgi:hypothetical protein
MRWQITDRGDPQARQIADRHYNRQSVGAAMFAPPGRALILVTDDADALWITSWPFAEYVKHAWAGAWICSAFRNESEHLASDLILEAVAVTRWKWDFLRAGFKPCGHTQGGLLAFQLLPENMPDATAPIHAQEQLVA